MIKNHIYFYFFFVPLLMYCGGCKKKNKKPTEIKYDNILIYSDLSNRLDKLPKPRDTLYINKIIKYFENNRKPLNDRSSILFQRANHYMSKCQNKIEKIDIEKIDTLSVKLKQKYVNYKGDRNLKTDIESFKESIRCSYKERDKGGLDLLSIIYNKINKSSNIKKTDFIKNAKGDTIKINKFDNHLFLFTDGYLEYSLNNSTPDYYFSSKKIEKIREFCIKKKISPEQALRDNDGLKIKPLVSHNNKLVNLYVLETADRGFDPNTGTYLHSGLLSDNNILKAVWKKWAKDSGFNKFYWSPININEIDINEIEKIIDDAEELHSNIKK